MNRIARPQVSRLEEVSALHQSKPDYVGAIELARAFAAARPVLQTFISVDRIEREIAYRLGSSYPERRAEAEARAFTILKVAMSWRHPDVP